VTIVGAGAIGLWIGWHLAQRGCQVSALARGDTLQALRSQGMRLQSGSGPVRTAPVHASDEPQALGVQDLVVLAVKAPALADVALRMGPLLGPHTVVLTAMNGVPWWFFEGFGGPLAGSRLQSIDPHGLIAQALPAGQVIGAVVHASCAAQAGLVHHHFGQRLVIGEPAGGTTTRLQALAALLMQAGFETEVAPCIQREIWFKLWGNMTMNPISALTGATGDRILDDPLVRAYLNAMMLEAREIGARFGIPIEQHPEQRHELTRKLGAFRTSMLQDTEAGRPLEIDALLGAVCEVGRRLEVPTPHLDSLLGMTRLMARTRGLHPEAGPEGETVS
jgi:2-dehydropantoate 2-reductase